MTGLPVLVAIAAFFAGYVWGWVERAKAPNARYWQGLADFLEQLASNKEKGGK